MNQPLFAQPVDPQVESVGSRITPLAIIFMLRAQSKCPEAGAMADDAVEILSHLVDHLIRIALQHGAPKEPEWWDHIADDLAALGDHLAAAEARAN